jgi:hypothetical protein
MVLSQIAHSYLETGAEVSLIQLNIRRSAIKKDLPLCCIMSSHERSVLAKVSEWRVERNRRSVERLKQLCRKYPKPVLVHALCRPLIPPLPRLAIDSYWRAHPVRADRLTRALAARTGAPSGWTWTVTGSREHGLSHSFRAPPAPYRVWDCKLSQPICPVFRSTN